ncbi:hypothetical protein [Rhizobium laguerreae]|uniref:hypothetical protein n=1 Tax=Rhizobium laguerreae TaxID=1076926 RepID=UPI001441CA72|nr:hypothetical protein [Rhizobium laguerreae]NKN12270.1 hypothetical protein [Rhizobium laguerreae]
MLHEQMTAYFTTLADFHPAVLRWAGDVLQDQPMLATTFAATLNVIIQQTQLLGIDDETAHELLVCLIEREAGPALRRLGISLPIPSPDLFSSLACSFREDDEISKVMLREPLMVEKGPIGVMRKSLWDGGLREPEVSLKLADLMAEDPQIH